MTTVQTGQATPSSHDRQLEPGTTVGEYVIERQLGQGGFGTVYRAVQPLIGKQVAIKVLAWRYSADEEVVSRFQAEARAVNQIRHRNIIDIFSFGQLPDGRQYYVMELLEGTPLDQHLEARGPLRPEAALPILRGIARALDAAHAKGIAHRDLKPENIVLTFDEDGASFPKLLDFGIAKLAPDERRAHKTGTGVPLGTPYYMSPEQCRGRDVDHRTDIYSFGVMTYRLLTGAYPFTGDLIEILHKQMHEEPAPASSVNPALTDDVDRAIAWMMRKDPAQRPASLAEAVNVLAGQQLTPMSLPATPATPRASTGGRPADVQIAETLAADTASSRGLASATAGGPAPAAAATLAGSAGPARRSRTPLRIALAVGVVAIGGAAGWILLGGGGGGAPARPPASPAIVAPIEVPPVAPPAAPRAPVPSVAPPSAPPTPSHVIVELAGAPAGTTVRMGATEIGVAPTIQLDHGTTAVVLTLLADGYQPTPITLVPDRDQTAEVTMKKKPRPAIRRRAPEKDDIIHNIPGLHE